MTVEQYMVLQESMKPDWYQALCDSDSHKDSSARRLRKSVERTLDYLDECLEKHNESEVGVLFAVAIISNNYDLGKMQDIWLNKIGIQPCICC